MREFFVSDVHIPFHDKGAYHILLKALQHFQPDILHLGGDIVDFHSISRHPKQLVESTLLKYEIDEARRELARLRTAAPNAQITFQEGNHDARLQVYLRDRAPELSGLVELELPNVLHLENLGIGWVPEKETYQVGKLWHHHGHLIAGGGVNPAKAKYAKTQANLIFGHHHRFDTFSTRQYGTNEVFQSIANANMYGINADYAHHTNWHIGFTVVDYIASGDFSANQIHIRQQPDGSSFAIIDGVLFESHDDEDIDKFLKINARALARRKSSR